MRRFTPPAASPAIDNCWSWKCERTTAPSPRQNRAVRLEARKPDRLGASARASEDASGNWPVFQSIQRADGLAFAGHRIFGRPAHQRRVVVAEQHLAEADRGLDLHLPVGARLGVAAAQRLHQRLGGLLDILLQVGIGPQRDLVDRKLAGIGAAHRDEIDQVRRFRRPRRRRPWRRREYPCRRAGAAGGGPGRARCRFPIAASWKYRPGSRSVACPRWNRCADRVRSAGRARRHAGS